MEDLIKVAEQAFNTSVETPKFKAGDTITVAYKIVEGNLDRCRITDKATLVFSEAKSFLMKKDNFDIAFLDPPYHKGMITDCLPMLTALMSEDGVIICETANDEELLQEVNGWLISKQKKYGKTKLTYYRNG